MSEAHARAWWEDVQHLREAAEQRIAERERAQRDGRLRARADRSPSAVTGSATALTSSSGPRATPSLPVTGSPAAITSSSAPPAAPPAALAGSAAVAATATALAIELEPDFDPGTEWDRGVRRDRFERDGDVTRRGPRRQSRFERDEDFAPEPRPGRTWRFDRAAVERERPSRREELSRLAREQARFGGAARPPGDAGTTPSRRTIEIRGQVARRSVIAAVPDPVDPALAPVRRRSRPGPSAAERFAARPDRVAQWAFLLGLFLIFVAAVSAHG